MSGSRRARGGGEDARRAGRGGEAGGSTRPACGTRAKGGEAGKEEVVKGVVVGVVVAVVV